MKEESDSLEEQLAEIGHIFQWTYFHVGLDRYQFLEDNFLGGGTNYTNYAGTKFGILDPLVQGPK